MGTRHTIWGMERETEWEPLLPSDGLSGLDAHGAWVREGDRVRCEAGSEGAHLLFGGDDWRDYEVRARVTAEAGGNIQIVFRNSADGTQGYLLDLLFGWQAVAISRRGRPGAGRAVEKLSVVNHELQRRRGYDVEIAAREFSLTSYVDGHLVNQVTAFDHVQGRFGLAVWNGRTTFERPMYRRLG